MRPTERRPPACLTALLLVLLAGCVRGASPESEPQPIAEAVAKSDDPWIAGRLPPDVMAGTPHPGGTLVQDLMPLPVNHKAGRAVAVAHGVAVAPESLVGKLAAGEEAPEREGFLRLGVNSSHHQAIGVPGDGLRVVARSVEDGVIEAVEGGQASAEGAGGHFVVGVQWHPERTYDESAASRALFGRFVDEAAAWVPRAVTASVV